MIRRERDELDAKIRRGPIDLADFGNRYLLLRLALIMRDFRMLMRGFRMIAGLS